VVTSFPLLTITQNKYQRAFGASSCSNALLCCTVAMQGLWLRQTGRTVCRANGHWELGLIQPAPPIFVTLFDTTSTTNICYPVWYNQHHQYLLPCFIQPAPPIFVTLFHTTSTTNICYPVYTTSNTIICYPVSHSSLYITTTFPPPTHVNMHLNLIVTLKMEVVVAQKICRSFPNDCCENVKF
jgi:hypothetical protein